MSSNPPPPGKKERKSEAGKSRVKFGMKPPCMQSLILDLPASDMHLLLMGGEADYIISTGGAWDGCGLFFSICPKMYVSDAGLIQFLSP